MLANRCGVLVNGWRPAQGAPSPPIWVKVRVESPSSNAMKWQPMPALAKLPSGSLVDVACGQPAQNAGTRFNKGADRSTTGGTGGSGKLRPADARNRVMPEATISGDNSINGVNKGSPRGVVLPLISGRSSAGR